jgi:hypothetical protein
MALFGQIYPDFELRNFLQKLECVIRNPFARTLFIIVALFLLAGAAFGESSVGEDVPKLKILILGGTGFIEPWEVEAALLEQFDSLPEDKRAEVMTRIPVQGEAEMIEEAKNGADPGK